MLYIMPCLLYDFYRWASMWRTDDYLGVSYYGFYYLDGTRKPIYSIELYDAFFRCRNVFPKQFKEFMSRRAEVKDYWFGISQVRSLKETLLKSNKYNCSKCLKQYRQDNCPIKLIHHEQLEYMDYMDYMTNPCDFNMKYRRR